MGPRFRGDDPSRIRWVRFAKMRGNRDSASSHDVKQPLSFPRRVFAPGSCIVASRTRKEGGRNAEKRSGARRHPLGLHMTRQARRLRGALRPIARQDARERAYDAGRSPLGAPPWRFWAPGAALLSPAFAPDRLQRAPRTQVVVPGGRLPEPPEASGYGAARRGTPRLAPHSGSSLEHALNERGCESYTLSSISSQEINSICLRAARTFISGNGRADRQVMAGRPSVAIRPLKAM